MFSLFPLLTFLCCSAILHLLHLLLQIPVMFLHNLSNVFWHHSPEIPQSNHLGCCACIFGSCCQSNPQRIRCQWNTHSKSITCTINYGCHSECYSIRVLDYTHTHTHTHSLTQTHTQTHTKVTSVLQTCTHSGITSSS